MDDYQPTLGDHIAVLKRRRWLIAGTFTGVLALGAALSFLIPPVYRSAGSILIESQQIPTDLVQAAVTSYADERIEVIKQRVMTRDNLWRIIRKYSLFSEAGSSFTPSEQIDEMRRTIAVDLVHANLRSDRAGPATISFSISFEHRRPEVAQAVANDLVTLFLEENVKVRTKRAAQTTEFLTQEAEKLQKDVAAIEAKVVRYKQEHASALPENIALGVAAMQRVEADLRQVERDHASAEDALRALESDRGVALAEFPPAAAVAASEASSELARARTELLRLAAIYTEEHPDLKAARRKVQALEQGASQEAARPAASPGRSRTTAALARIDGRAATLRDRVRVLAGQRLALRERLGQMDAALIRSPETERGLLALTRDYQSAQKKYEEFVDKKMTAQVAESLEGGQKAERFAMLDPPNLPDKPFKPNRKKLLALSFLLAIGAAGAAVVLLESLRERVRGIRQIAALWGAPPLVAIPVIPVAAERAQRRRQMLAMAGGGALAGCFVLVLVHFLFLPLDVIVMKAMVRMG
jgi:polysaccharide biosynthesis transport protein